MAHYTDFKLYWEDWGGYPDRSCPFGEPTLMWVIATKDRTARCIVDRAHRGAMDVTWNAKWKGIPYSLVEPLPNLLEEAGVFTESKPLVEDAADGDYLAVWDLTGIVRARAFHISLKFTCPGERWTPLGQKVEAALYALRSYEGATV